MPCSILPNQNEPDTSWQGGHEGNSKERGLKRFRIKYIVAVLLKPDFAVLICPGF